MKIENKPCLGNEHLVHRTCAVCGSSVYDDVFIKDDISYVRCGSCDLVYINPMPTGDALQADYDKLGDEYFTDDRKIATDFADGRFDRELNFLTQAGADGRLLDVGCATGSFLEAAHASGIQDVVGIDIAKPSVEYAVGRGLTAHAGDFTEGFFPENSFDTVTMLATLEHLPDPNQFVVEAARVLRPGGLFVATVPNTDALSTKILRDRDRYYSVHHLNYFNKNNFRELFEKNGFCITAMDTRGINPFKIWEDYRRVPIDIEKQIQANELTTKIRSKPRNNISMSIFYSIDKLLSIVGYGDLLLMAGRLGSEK